MKLLLTSDGLTTDSLIQDFLNLLGHNPKGLHVAFIPTAANGEMGKRITDSTEELPGWLEKDVTIFKKLGMVVTFINLEDLNENNIVSTFAQFGVIFMEGGNTFFLMHHIINSGFQKHIQEILKDKVYIGVSAGSIIAGPDLSLALFTPGGDVNDVNLQDMAGLALISNCILPHWNGIVPQEAKDYGYKIQYLRNGEGVAINE